jgi:hypothetical protein
MSGSEAAVAKFNPTRLQFGRRPIDDGDDGEGLPRPLTTRAAIRRAAGIKEAAEVLARLPGPGESLHAVCTARLDLTDVLNALLQRLGTCERMRIATLGYNERNLSAMLAWLDAGAVGQLSLVASLFFRAHKGDLWTETLAEVRKRKQRAACCHSHAKVCTLAFAGGNRLAIEGSANLCGNGSGREQFALFNDVALHDWHATWIDELVTRHEGRAEQDEDGQG